MEYKKNSEKIDKKMNEKIRHLATMVLDTLVDDGTDEVHFSIKDQTSAFNLMEKRLSELTHQEAEDALRKEGENG